MDALTEAEAYLTSSAQRTAVAVAALSHVAPRVAELQQRSDASDARLATAQADAAASLKDFKVVAARMVQDREAAVSSLRKQLAAVQAPGAGDASAPAAAAPT